MSRPRAAGAARLRVEVEADQTFGPVLRCGAAGTAPAELPALVCPLYADDAATLLGDESLAEVVPSDPAGRAAAAQALEASAAMAAAHAEIASLRLDPRLVAADGTVVAGAARVGVCRPPMRRPWPRTWE